MSKLTSYTCKECGGVLNFDSDQDVFGCPFCGNNFNYADFHRKDLLDQAEQNLKRCEFKLAEEKYKAVLVNAPYDFDARLGLVYCAGKLTGKSNLQDLKKMLQYDPAHSGKRAERFASDSNGEDAVYFSKLAKLLSLAAEYKDISDQIANISSMTVTKLDNTKMPVDKVKEFRLKLFAGDLFIGTLFVLFLYFIFFKSKSEEVLSATLFAAFIFIVAGIILSIPFEDLFPSRFQKETIKVRDEKHKIIEGSMRQKESFSERLLEIEQLYPDAFRELEKSIPETSPSDTEMHITTNKPNENTSFVLNEQILCNKCGGRLTLDKSRNFLLCSSCGVAFGTSLFFGEPKKKAYESLERHEYAEADQSFLQVLMRDPHDFEALRGRILCAGKWGNGWDKGELSLQWVKTLQKRVDEALQNAREEDHSYFIKYKEIAYIYEQKRDSDIELMHIRKARPDLYKFLDIPNVISYDDMFLRLKELIYTRKILTERLDNIFHEIKCLDIERELI